MELQPLLVMIPLIISGSVSDTYNRIVEDAFVTVTSSDGGRTFNATSNFEWSIFDSERSTGKLFSTCKKNLATMMVEEMF